jgi:hypothetical protein
MNTKLRRILGTPTDKIAPEDVDYLARIAKCAAEVRLLQIEYFNGGRSGQVLNQARAAEKRLDDLIDESDQLGLFGGRF